MRLYHQLLAATSLVSLGPIVVAGVVSYLYVQQQFVRVSLGAVDNLAALEAGQAHHSVEHKRFLLRSMASAERELWSRIAEVEQCPDGEYAAAAAHLQMHLEQQWPHDPGLRDLAVFSSSGTLLAVTGSGSDEWMHGTCDPDQDGGTVLQYHEGEGEPELIQSASIVDERGDRNGVLCGRFTFDVHNFLVKMTGEQMQDAASYLVGPDGRVLCSSVPDNEGIGLERPLDPPGRKRSAARGPWHERYDRGHGAGEVLAAYAPAKDLGWGVLVEVPVDSALAPLEVLKRQLFTLAPLLLLALIVVVSLLSRRLSRPLARLADAVRRTAQGVAVSPVPAEGPRESVELADAFNDMSAAVQEARADLQQRIDERTRELLDSRAFLELILNSIEQRVLVVDSELIITRANRMAVSMHGEHIIGAAYADALRPDPDAVEALRETLATGQAGCSEGEQETASGQEIVRTDTFAVRGATGAVEAVVEVARVVTRERELQAHLAHQEKMATLGVLAAGVAHDIGNPLSSILSQLRMARGGGASAQQTLSVVEAEMKRMARLLRELTDFTRRKRDRTQRVDVRTVIDDAVRLLRHDPRARGVVLEVDVDPDLAPVWASEDDLMQILLNLGINALDAMPDGGELRFEARPTDGGVRVHVRDTGAGIPDSVRSQVFEPLVSSKHDGRGTGLGLFVSRGIVEGLGGTLELEQTGEAGTTFVVYLPAIGKAA